MNKSSKHLLITSILFSLVLLCLAAPAHSATWNRTTVDSTGTVGEYTSLALNSAGNPCISYNDETNYTNGDLKYAYYDGTEWHTETVDSEGDVSAFTSLALNSAGNPCISYHDYRNGTLKYAYYDGTNWHTQTVDTTGIFGSDTSLALNDAGNPCISYNVHGDLKYASGTTPTPTATPPDNTEGNSTSMILIAGVAVAAGAAGLIVYFAKFRGKKP